MSALRTRKYIGSWILLLVVVLLASSVFLFGSPAMSLAQEVQPDKDSYIYLPIVTGSPPLGGEYVLLGWNDLGMHCYNKDFSNLGVLPPYNNLWAQVIRRGDPPQIVTEGISVSYAFPENTYSVGKSNFWDYAKALFGVQSGTQYWVDRQGSGRVHGCQDRSLCGGRDPLDGVQR